MGRGLSPLQRRLLVDAAEHGGKITTRRAKQITTGADRCCSGFGMICKDCVQSCSKLQSVAICRALRRLQKRWLMFGHTPYHNCWSEYELTEEGKKVLSVCAATLAADTNKCLSAIGMCKPWA